MKKTVFLLLVSLLVICTCNCSGTDSTDIKEVREKTVLISEETIYADQTEAEKTFAVDGVELFRYLGNIEKKYLFLGSQNNHYGVYVFDEPGGEGELAAELPYQTILHIPMRVIGDYVYLNALTNEGNELVRVSVSGEVTVIRKWKFGKWHGTDIAVCKEGLLCSSDTDDGRMIEIYDTQKDEFKTLIQSVIDMDSDGMMTGTDLLTGGGLSDDGFYYLSVPLKQEVFPYVSQTEFYYYGFSKKKARPVSVQQRLCNNLTGDERVLFVSESDPDEPISPGVIYVMEKDHIDKISVETYLSNWRAIEKQKELYIAEAANRLYFVDLKSEEVRILTAKPSKSKPDYQCTLQLLDPEENECIIFKDGEAHIVDYRTAEPAETGSNANLLPETSDYGESVECKVDEDITEFETYFLRIDTGFEGVTNAIVLPAGDFFETEEPAFVYTEDGQLEKEMSKHKSGERVKVTIPGGQTLSYDDVHPCQIRISDIQWEEELPNASIDDGIRERVRSYHNFEIQEDQ